MIKMIKMILAVDQGNAIGWTSGALPWRSSTDLKRFKALTLGHSIVMGFNTFKSLNNKLGLRSRNNYVLSRRHRDDLREFVGDYVTVLQDFEFITRLNKIDPNQTTWICGGAQVYGAAIELGIVDEIHLTQVHTASGADVVLPWDMYGWKLFVLRERERGIFWELIDLEYAPQEDGSPNLTFLTFRKIASAP